MLLHLSEHLRLYLQHCSETLLSVAEALQLQVPHTAREARGPVRSAPSAADPLLDHQVHSTEAILASRAGTCRHRRSNTKRRRTRATRSVASPTIGKVELPRCRHRASRNNSNLLLLLLLELVQALWQLHLRSVLQRWFALSASPLFELALLRKLLLSNNSSALSHLRPTHNNHRSRSSLQ